MKILYYISYPQRLAGSQRQIINLLVHLDREKYEPIVLLPFAGVAKEFIEKRGVRVEIIEPQGILNTFGKTAMHNSFLKNLFSGTRDYLKYSFAVRRFIKKENIDMVHCGEPRATLMAGLGARLAGRKVVAHIQGEVPFGGYFMKLFKTIPHKIICNAEFVKRFVSAGKSLPKAQTVYSGIEKPVADKALNSQFINLHREKGTLVMSVFASAVPFKGYHVLIEAMRIIKEKYGELPVIVLGIGDFVESYKWYEKMVFEKINEYEIDNLIMLGWQNDPFRFLEVSDYTCLPSISEGVVEYEGTVHKVKGNEGFPTTHLEAMMLGKPIIGTKISGVPEQIVDGETGILVMPDEPEELADAIYKMTTSEEFRKKCSERALTHVDEKFSIKSYTTAMDKVYTDLMNG
jgi:glycosyltransferase involved in cell wall biosynthesis